MGWKTMNALLFVAFKKGSEQKSLLIAIFVY